MRLNRAVDAPDADHAVGVPSVQRRAVGRPRQRRARVLHALLGRRREVGPELDDRRLGLEVPDLDARGRGRAEPVAVGRERQRRDRVPGVERVEALALGQVPQARDAVLAARGAERAVGRDGDGGDVAGVLDEVEAELAVGEVPDL